MKNPRLLRTGWTALAVLMLATLLFPLPSRGRIPPPSSARGLSFFERIGDLPGDAHYSEARDLDHFGDVLVGESWADDPSVPNDGLSTWAGTGPWPHAFQAIAFRPACTGHGPYGSGLTGLGYSFPTDRAESVANGVSPDGTRIVGWCNTGVGVTSEAVIFNPNGTKTLLGKLPGHQSSMAREVSGLPRRQPGPRGDWLSYGRFGARERVIVGFSSLANDIPQKRAGGQAVYWTEHAPAQLLATPVALPNGMPVVSAEAFSVSDGAQVIVGNLYYDGPPVDGVRYPAYACVWERGPGGSYGMATVLDVLASATPDSQVADLSGNGLVAVGHSNDGSNARACSWKRGSSGWTLTGLDILPGMQYSIALAVDFDGRQAVGTSGFFDPLTFDFGLRPVRWTLLGAHAIEDLQPLLAAAYPAQGIDDSFVLEATAISGDGKIIAGRMNFLAPTSSDPFATLDEGWIARMP